jgi:uncharacterized protein YecT (DUF1311 family)
MKSAEARFSLVALAVSLVSFCAAPALAQLPSQPCDSYTTTNEIYQCLLREYVVADSLLNTTYAIRQAVLKSYSLPRSQALTAAQRAWISLRDLDCASEGKAFDGGTFEKVIVQGCLVRKTQERTRYLETHYETEAP